VNAPLVRPARNLGQFSKGSSVSAPLASRSRTRPSPVLASAYALVLLACSGGSELARDDPGTVRAPRSYPHDVRIEHTVTAVHARGRHTFRAILEKRGDALVLVGLGPHGGRAFVLAQEGETIRFESHLPQELPFSPRYMLLDVHRVWFLGIFGAPRHEGEHRAEIEGEEVVEHWADGRLVSRAFRRLDGRPPGWIRIAYHGGLSPDPASDAPERIELDNDRLGYRLIIEHITRMPLDGT